MNKKQSQSLSAIFEEVAMPDDEGYSKEVYIKDLIEINEGFALGNGGSWCRSDGQLGRKYNIKRIKENNKIIAVKLDGFNRDPKGRNINASIKKVIVSRRCAVLDIGTNIECDHKNGKYNKREMEDSTNQQLNDFQPLSKGVNIAKRQHCKECVETGIRYDAKKLGYSVSYLKGDADSKNCEGCYWYDPQAFNRVISQGYKKDL
ncbi:MAG: restriction endonuclease [Clostridiales bacterium]|jgi:hypothetical protein|nr:restriction endonuclease [Clostridiales bacterium]